MSRFNSFSKIGTNLLVAFALAGAFGFSMAEGQADDGKQPERNVLGSDYKLAFRDTVEFKMVEEPDMTTVQRLSASGEISVPMLGSIKIGGRTLREAEQILQEKYLMEGYFMKPQVILSVQSYAERKISILGQVNRPDQIAIPVEQNDIGLVKAITQAGGFTRVARSDAVKVIRTVNGREEQYTINVAAYLDSKETPVEFRLLPDDLVYVPERVF